MEEPLSRPAHTERGDSKSRCGKRTLSINCINESAFVPLAPSQPLELSRRPSRPSGQDSSLIKILDYLDMLDVVAALLRLNGAAIAGTAKLVVFLISKLVGALKPQA